MKFTVLTYERFREHQWTIHKAGCKDIQKEQRGMNAEHSPAMNPEHFEADNFGEAVAQFLKPINDELRENDGENAGQFDIRYINVAPCCKI